MFIWKRQKKNAEAKISAHVHSWKSEAETYSVPLLSENRMSNLDKSSPFLGDTGERVAELEFFRCRSLLTLTLPIHTKTNLVDIIKTSVLDHRDEGHGISSNV